MIALIAGLGIAALIIQRIDHNRRITILLNENRSQKDGIMEKGQNAFPG